MTGSGTARQPGQRVRLIAFMAMVWLLWPAAPASADSAAPTNYKSTVLDVEPADSAATFEVVGGDGFLEITVAPGHSALVPGYFDDPYVRIDPDGTVWINHDSPAYYINQDRYGRVQAPPEADGRGEPEWEQVATGGRFAWQDHRIHWMSFDLPPTVTGDHYQFVFPWDLPIEVDGQEVSVRGELVWVPSRNLYPALLAGVVGLLPTIWKRSRRLIPMAVFAAVSAITAIVITITQLGGTPAVARTIPLAAAAPPAAVAVAAIVVALRNRSSNAGPWLLLGCGVFLVVWAIANIGMLWLPVLPTASSSDLQRAGASFVLWSAIAVVGAAIVLALRGREDLPKTAIIQ
jgi:hypothetical protein